MLIKLFSVFIGGGLGAILRYLAGICSQSLFNKAIYGTFAVNIIGCFLIGAVFAFTLDKIDAINPTLKLLITAGFLGGLTTFSTFNLEVFELIKNGKPLLGFVYLVSSCLFGLMATFLAYLIFRQNNF